MSEQQPMVQQPAVRASLPWVPAEDETQPEIRWRVTWQMFCANKGAVFGLLLQ